MHVLLFSESCDIFHTFCIFNFNLFPGVILLKCLQSRYIVSATPPPVLELYIYFDLGLKMCLWLIIIQNLKIYYPRFAPFSRNT